MLRTDSGRVTAGLPSLLPEKRNKYINLEKTRAHAAESIKTAQKRELAAVMTDPCVDLKTLKNNVGKPLTTASFVQRVRKMNPNIVYQQTINNPRYGAFYIQKDITPLEKAMGGVELQHICGMESQMMPEFTVPHTKKEYSPSASGDEIGRAHV